MQHYTYIHTKADTGEIFYVGKGVRDRAFTNLKRNAYWKNVVAKHGYNSKILAYWKTPEEALDHEKLLILCFRDMGYKLTNLTDGGEGSWGYKHTAASLAKITGVKKSYEHIEKIRAAQSKKTGVYAQHFKGKIIATCCKTKNETAFCGRKELELAGFKGGAVYNCVNGKRKTHKGHTFKREEK